MIRAILKNALPWMLELACKSALVVMGGMILYLYGKERINDAAIAFAATVVLTAFSMWFSSRSRRLLARRNKRAATKKLLRTLATVFDDRGTKHVRAHLMMSNRRRTMRCVDGETAHNMHEDPDETLCVNMYEGISGQAAKRREPVIADVAEMLFDPNSSMLPKRKRKSRRTRKSLKAVLSVPILSPDDQEGDLLGTLQVDSDAPASLVFPDEVRAGQIATNFADALSLVLGA
jgi:hypothetical protein